MQESVGTRQLIPDEGTDADKLTLRLNAGRESHKVSGVSRMAFAKLPSSILVPLSMIQMASSSDILYVCIFSTENMFSCDEIY